MASLALFGVAYVFYLAIGALIVFGTGSVPIDTWARVGNASYALFSRDPHLGAIGFVLPPIPTLAIVPILPFKALWPALVTSAFAGPITSAAFMAGSVVLVRRILRDVAVSTWLAWPLVALFALHPMIVYYGANGLTEAPFVFCLLWATSSCLRWLDRGALADLVRLGMALAIGYLTRYEFIAAAPLAVGLVAAVTYFRTPGATGDRRTAAVADAVIAGLPFALAFVGWALVSWLLVGSPFSQFTSIYGNTSQVQLLHDTLIQQTGQGTTAAFGYVAAQVLGLAPLLPIVGLLALARAGLRLDRRVLAPIAIIGAPLGFSVFAFLTGSTVGFLRYEIAAIPLMIVFAGLMLARRRAAARMAVRASASGAAVSLRARLLELRQAAARLVVSASASAVAVTLRARLEALRQAAARLAVSASASAVAVTLRARLEALRQAAAGLAVSASASAVAVSLRARLLELRQAAARLAVRASASAALVTLRARLLELRQAAVRQSRIRVGAVIAWWRGQLPFASRVSGPVLGVLIVIGIGLSLPTGLATMRHPLLAREEADALRSVLGNDPPSSEASYVLATHAAASRIAATIDTLDLSSGEVLLDVAAGNPIVLQSAHPDRFVITTDRDFDRVLADPATFGVRYLLVTNNPLDAVNRTYPGLYATGAGFATLIETYDETGSAGWRLYRLDPKP
jgi:hypothetical protein